jgi:LysR family transcriptional regulator, benzoate and cis,cis-muconate-responsive activator of ben and cat genes
MNRRQFEYFVAAAEELNLHRTAERLNISQPSLSRNILALEETLGVALFVRRPTGLQLSDAGTHMLIRARTILHAMDDAAAEAKLVDAGAQGRLRIGYIGSATFGLLPMVLEDYWKAYPNVALSLEIMTNSELSQAIISRKIDVALSRYALVDDHLASEDVLTEPFCLAVPRHVDDETARSTPRLLETFRLVVYPERPRPSFADMVLAHCAEVGAPPRRGIVETMDVFTALALVREGLGVTVVPRSAGRSFGKGVSLFELTPAMPDMVIAANYRRDAQQVLIYNFLAAIRKVGRALSCRT